jgi:hypothetical protein
MSARYGTFVMLVLLFAVAAFVVDVLSPVTPTPNANFVVKLLLVVFCILARPTLLNPPTAQIAVARPKPINGGRNPRVFITWLCVFLC